MPGLYQFGYRLWSIMLESNQQQMRFELIASAYCANDGIQCQIIYKRSSVPQAATTMCLDHTSPCDSFPRLLSFRRARVSHPRKYLAVSPDMLLVESKDLRLFTSKHRFVNPCSYASYASPNSTSIRHCSQLSPRGVQALPAALADCLSAGLPRLSSLRD